MNTQIAISFKLFHSNLKMQFSAFLHPQTHSVRQLIPNGLIKLFARLKTLLAPADNFECEYFEKKLFENGDFENLT